MAASHPISPEMRTTQVTESGCRTRERTAAVTAHALVYCRGGFIVGRGGAALGNFHGLACRVERSLSGASGSSDHDGESGGLSGQAESKYFGPRAGQAAETIR